MAFLARTGITGLVSLRMIMRDSLVCGRTWSKRTSARRRASTSHRTTLDDSTRPLAAARSAQSDKCCRAATRMSSRQALIGSSCKVSRTTTRGESEASATLATTVTVARMAWSADHQRILSRNRSRDAQNRTISLTRWPEASKTTKLQALTKKLGRAIGR